MTTSFSSLLRLIDQIDPKPDIHSLIEDIRRLSYRIAHPETQSEYFRWGMQNHVTRLNQMCHTYQQLAAWYNAHHPADMATERAQCLQQARLLLAGEMTMGRAIRVNALNSRIARMDAFIRLKSITSVLPPVMALLPPEWVATQFLQATDA